MAQNRGLNGCLCCGKNRLIDKSSIISPFFAYKAWGGEPEHVILYECQECGFRFFERGLTETEVNTYYNGYRSEEYFAQRHHFEPFYTRAEHDSISTFLASKERGEELSHLLRRINSARSFECVIDYGGGDGSLIIELNANRKISFDPSGAPGRFGVEVIRNRKSLPIEVDLIVCAQVIEHVSDPGALIEDITSLLRSSGILYLEVPQQMWKDIGFMKPRKAWLSWLSRHPRLLLAADIYSTSFRVKLGFLPPFGFVPMREHINFFTPKALVEITRRCGLTVLEENFTAGGSIYLLAKKC
jgi:SAM-dependent methyltransferase